jgi:hypothetical protein
MSVVVGRVDWGLPKVFLRWRIQEPNNKKISPYKNLNSLCNFFVKMPKTFREIQAIIFKISLLLGSKGFKHIITKL